jgi:hypothetical protein
MGDKRNIMLLVILLIVFAIIFFIALLGLQHNETLFDIGIPMLFENWLIMFLSIGSIVKIVVELYKN